MLLYKVKKSGTILAVSVLMAMLFVFTGCADTELPSGGITDIVVSVDREAVGNNGSVYLYAGDIKTFRATVTGGSNVGFIWTVAGDAGVVQLSNEIGSTTDIKAVKAGVANIKVEASDNSGSAESEFYIYVIGVTDVSNVLYYSHFGAVGDGIADDFDAIIAAHAEANIIGAKVRADAGASYYIGGANSTAIIQTDTDWTGASFTIDDSAITTNGSWVFDVTSVLSSRNLRFSITSMNKGQDKLNLSLSSPALIYAVDNQTLRYKRSGGDANSGSAQTDVFLVDKDGNVDPKTPIIWNFNRFSTLTAYPIDENTLTIKGGTFTTIANRRNSGYMLRGIRVRRSNTVVDRIVHYVTEEGAQSGPYDAFLKVENCANVTVKNTTFTGRRYYNIAGTYDFNAIRTVNLSVIDCDQTNDIANDYYWGVFASNYSKNIRFERVKFSRFDAHQGVHNATILDSKLGHSGVSIIGSGLLRIENTSVTGAWSFISFRNDYGSTWEGEVEVRNCTFAPNSAFNSRLNGARILFTQNDGTHDYGYDCYMPKTITIEGFTVVDNPPPSGYQGILLVQASDTAPTAPYQLALTETIYLSGFVSSMPYRMSPYVDGKINVVFSP